MKIQRIEIINFRKIDKMVLDNLQDKNIISFIGKNGTGKTSILKAIEFNLTGNSDDVGITKDKMKVDITYIVNKDNVNVVREKGGIFKVSIQSGNEWVVTDGRKKEVQEYLEKIMGRSSSKDFNLINTNDYKDWRNLIFIRNCTVHNNAISDRDKTFDIGGMSVVANKGKMMQGNLYFFAVLTEVAIERYFTWVKALINKYGKEGAINEISNRRIRSKSEGGQGGFAPSGVSFYRNQEQGA